MAKGEDKFEDFMYGPVLVPIAALGIIGNILSVIVYSRPSMKKSAISIILIGLFLRLILFIRGKNIMGCQLHNAGHPAFSKAASIYQIWRANW